MERNRRVASVDSSKSAEQVCKWVQAKSVNGTVTKNGNLSKLENMGIANIFGNACPNLEPYVFPNLGRVPFTDLAWTHLQTCWLILGPFTGLNKGSSP